MKRERVGEQKLNGEKKRTDEKSEERNKRGRPKKWTDERIQEEADALNEWIDKKLADKHFDPTMVVWVKDFAIERKYSTQRLSEWASSHEGFSEAYARAREVQESQLASGGLLKFYDPGFTKFVLVNNHKESWADKQTTELTGKDNGDIEFVFKIVEPKPSYTVNDSDAGEDA